VLLTGLRGRQSAGAPLARRFTAQPSTVAPTTITGLRVFVTLAPRRRRPGHRQPSLYVEVTATGLAISADATPIRFVSGSGAHLGDPRRDHPSIFRSSGVHSPRRTNSYNPLGDRSVLLSTACRCCHG
jgi:hypothetical protein